MTDDARFKEIIKERLTERRYNHSLCVADSAKSLAKKYGADENKAYTAGLLHDVFKDAKKEEQLEYLLRPHGIMTRRVELTEGWYKDCAGPLLGVNTAPLINVFCFSQIGSLS